MTTPRALDFVFMRRRAEELENVSKQEAPRKPQKALEMKIVPAPFLGQAKTPESNPGSPLWRQNPAPGGRGWDPLP